MAAIFKFWNVPEAGGTKAPLELEFQSEKSEADASVDHVLQIKLVEQGRLIEVATTLQVKTRADFLDIQLPRLPIPRLDFLGFSVGASFPVAMEWLSLAPPSGLPNMSQAIPLNFTCEEEGLKLAAPDGPARRGLPATHTPWEMRSS